MKVCELTSSTRSLPLPVLTQSPASRALIPFGVVIPGLRSPTALVGVALILLVTNRKQPVVFDHVYI